MLKRLVCDFSHVDERGTLVQLVHNGWKQFNVITSKKGTVRGGHYHKLNREAFYIISGALEIQVNQECAKFGPGDFFSIEPFDMHSFYFLEDTVLVSMYSQGVEMADGTKDIYTK